MEKEENKVIEDVQIPVQDENITVDNNTELDASDYNPDETGSDVLTGDPVVDAPVEDPTLASTDEIIPAPVDVAGEEPIADPVVDPIIPEEPAALTPEEPVLDAPLADIAPPMQDIPVEEPVENPELAPAVDGAVPGSDVVPGAGDETPADGCCIASCDNAVTVANLFGTLQESVTIAWRFHLKTRKHHIHIALNEFYENALKIVDDIIEQYQGICGVVEDTFTNCVVGDGKTEGEYLTELKAFIENNKCVLGDHSEINSTIDEFLGLIDSTLYKLTSFTESAVKSFDEFVYEDYPAIKEACKYDRFGERSCDDPDDSDYDPDFDGECSAEEE